MKRIQKAVIPVAGLGTRGLPFTKEVPKEMLPIIETPTIHFIVDEVLSAGIQQVIFVTSKGKSALEDYFDPSPSLVAFLRKRGKADLADQMEEIGKMCEVISVRQKEPLGLGHAVYCTKAIIGDEPFAVCLGDEVFPSWGKSRVPALKTLVDFAYDCQGSVAGYIELPESELSSYGILKMGKKHPSGAFGILGTVEKPKPADAPSRNGIVGRYVFQPEIFDRLEKVQAGIGGEIQLTDAMDMLAKEGKLFGVEIQGERYDVGNHLSFLKAQIQAGLNRSDLKLNLLKYLKEVIKGE